jgi:hypothetical protein
MLEVVIGTDNHQAIEVRAGREMDIPQGEIRVKLWFRGLEKDKLSFRQALIMIGRIWQGEILPWEAVLDDDRAKELIAALEKARVIAKGENS